MSRRCNVQIAIRDHGCSIHSFFASVTKRFGRALRGIVLPVHTPAPIREVNVKEMQCSDRNTRPWLQHSQLLRFCNEAVRPRAERDRVACTHSSAHPGSECQGDAMFRSQYATMVAAFTASSLL